MTVSSFCDAQAGMNTYLVSEGDHCFLIDPILSGDLMEALEGQHIDFALLTHEHYDHIRGVNDLKSVGDIPVLCGKSAIRGLQDPAVNMSRFIEFLNMVLPFGDGTAEPCEYRCSADQTVEDGELRDWQGHTLLFKETPGHSAGSISLLLDDRLLFSGDVIFRNYATATRLPGGNTRVFKQITEPWLNRLAQDIIVYPGHTGSFVLAERYHQ